MEEVVLRFGSFRELLTDGAPELTSGAIDVLIVMLQAQRGTAVPYRPQTIGLVERFHRTWNDCVAVFMQDKTRKDWSLWVRFAVYAYNSARHSTVMLTPNELMMGRKLRAPNELLRRTEVSEVDELTAYHEQLLKAMERSQRCAEQARVREQERQARYYDRQVRNWREFHPGDRVWLYNPPRGPKATKFVHQWMGPLKIVEPAGYENFLLCREDKTGERKELIEYVSFLLSYYEPSSPLSQVAADIDEQLEYEDARQYNAATAAATGPAAAEAGRATANGGAKRGRTAMARAATDAYASGRLVEQRRRRKRNAAGHYVLQYQLFPFGDPTRWRTEDRGQWMERNGQPRSRWVTTAEYEQYYQDERVVEDP
ncbi:hypothetical protein V7S43_019110 [Phytophthora oleae]|uniref:Integrase catalytic domain-containing protein n=1 Tax=Phytophthora oleae TaxID=2107226 RepID=A0ABD3EQR1_9STRA